MIDTGLQCRLRKYSAEGLWHAFKTIGHGDQHIFDATRFKVVENLHPELCAFGTLDPDAQDIARTVW
ncbi:hypothetical protein D3C79_1075370 [compost metagenome]